MKYLTSNKLTLYNQIREGFTVKNFMGGSQRRVISKIDQSLLLDKVFSCDKQLKKFVRPFVRPSPFFSFIVLEVSSCSKECQWCFNAV